MNKFFYFFSFLSNRFHIDRYKHKCTHKHRELGFRVKLSLPVQIAHQLHKTKKHKHTHTKKENRYRRVKFQKARIGLNLTGEV